MIQPDRITSEITGLVGWNQPTLADYDIVDATNLASVSGLKFDQASSLISIKNIKEAQEDKDISDAEFNALLVRMQNDVILDVCNKVSLGESDHIQTNNLYPYEKTFSDVLSTDSKFVGFRIVPAKMNNIISRISAIEIAFNASSTFNIYLFNSNRSSAIQTQSVTASQNQSVIVNLGWIIGDSAAYKGGDFYIGYFEDDLSGAQPYSRNYELSTYKVETCYYYVEPIKVTHSSNVLDVSTYQNQPDTGGLNIIIDVYNDYTELFVRNKNKLAFAVQMQMAEKVLDLIKNTTRENFEKRRTSQIAANINTELLGFQDQFIFKEGIISKINRAILDLKKDFFPKRRITRNTIEV